MHPPTGEQEVYISAVVVLPCLKGCTTTTVRAKYAPMMTGESTFWYFLARRTWDAVSTQIDESLEPMNLRARECQLPIEWKRDRAILWATVCRVFMLSKLHIPQMSSGDFPNLCRGASALFSSRGFFDMAHQRLIGNVNSPAFAGREPLDSVADTFALGSASYRGPGRSAEGSPPLILQEPMTQWVVTDELVHKASLLAVMSEGGFWEDCLAEYARRRPGWFRRQFTDARKWLFPHGQG